MERPPESLKSFADRIAQAAANEEADQLVCLLRISGLTGEIANRVQHYGRRHAYQRARRLAGSAAETIAAHRNLGKESRKRADQLCAPAGCVEHVALLGQRRTD